MDVYSKKWNNYAEFLIEPSEIKDIFFAKDDKPNAYRLQAQQQLKK